MGIFRKLYILDPLEHPLLLNAELLHFAETKGVLNGGCGASQVGRLLSIEGDLWLAQSRLLVCQLGRLERRI